MKKIFILLFLTYSFLSATVQFGNQIDKGIIENDEITEASGIAASLQNDAVFWTHNDSGGENVLFAFDINGSHLGKYFLPDIEAIDWEDIAIGQIDNENMILIADIGNNAFDRDTLKIIIVTEPEIDLNQTPDDFNFDNYNSFNFQYPNNESYDAETLLFDSITEDIYVISKRHSGNYDKIFKVIKADYLNAIQTGNLVTLEYMGELNLPSYLGSGAVAGDISSSGLEILIKTYSTVYYWDRDPDQSIEEALSMSETAVTYSIEPQGEAICWRPDSGGYYTISEEQSTYPAHLFYYPRVDHFITLTNSPTDMYRPDEEMQLNWNPEIECELHYSTSPSGRIISNYTSSSIAGISEIITTPAELGLNVGIYYCVLHNSAGNYTSIEFTITVETAETVQMLTPENGSEITNPVPTFSWETNPGVPYYLITVSDNPFTVEEDENGEIQVVGIQPIWQIITPNTSTEFRSQDPSGNFVGNPPDLCTGIEYYWFVANNYHNTPMTTSKVIPSPFSFTYYSDNYIDDPILNTPVSNAELDDETITFSWDEVENASLYQIFLYEVREENLGTMNIVIWNPVTSNCSIELNAGNILLNSEYTWRVVASSGEGASSSSLQNNFFYTAEVGTLSLHVRNLDNGPVPFVNAELSAVYGSEDIIPLIVNSGGNEVKTISPGTYIVSCSKDGYEDTENEVTVMIDNEPLGEGSDVTQFTVFMEYSPSSVLGSVRDYAGNLMENVSITALSSDDEERTIFTSTGDYGIYLIPGLWEISASKPGFHVPETITVNIEAQENIAVDDLIMLESQKSVTGFVFNGANSPLSGVTVTATSNDEIITEVSNQSGSYIFDPINLGDWTITAEKIGYLLQSERVISITESSPDIINLDDLVLLPMAVIVRGDCTNGDVGLNDVEVVATPSSGTTTTTMSENYGAYSLSLNVQTYQINAIKDGFYTTNSYQVSPSAGETIDNIDFVFYPDNATISGNITSEGSGIANVTISTGSEQTTTNEMGNYTFSIGAGTYDLSATKTGYSSNIVHTISVGNGQAAENIDFELFPNASTISGSILSGSDYVANASVFAQKISTGGISLVYSDEDGIYELNLNHGQYRIWPEKAGFICLEADTLHITAAPGQNIPNQNIQLATYEVYIEGTVFNQTSIVQNANIMAVDQYNNSYSTVSNAEGNFFLIVEPNNSYEVSVNKLGYSTDLFETTVLALQQLVTVEFHVQELPSTISGAVISDTGDILNNVMIRAISNDDEFISYSSANGFYDISTYSGTVELQASKLGYIPNSVILNVPLGANLDNVDFILEANFSSIFGIITDEVSSDRLADVLVSAEISSGGGSAITNELGEYILTGLIPGLYSTISFSISDYQTKTLENIVIPGNTVIEINDNLIPFTSSITVDCIISGVTILIENTVSGDTYSAVTNENGLAEINGIESHTELIVSAMKTNYLSNPENYTVELLPNENLTLSFQMTLNSSEITGYVYDPDGYGIADVRVDAISDDGFAGFTYSTASGSFLITNLAVNHLYNVIGEVTGYSQYGESSILVNAASHTTDLTMFENNLVVTGVLQDQEGEAITDKSISASISTATSYDITDQFGNFLIEGCAINSNYIIQTEIIEEGFENSATTVQTDTINVDIGILVADVHTSELTGVVTDLNTGEPVNGASLILEYGETDDVFTATSSSEGEFRIENLYAGDYQLTVSKNFYQTLQTGMLTILHKTTLDYDVEIIYIAPVIISGFVFDTDNRAIEGVQVNAFDSGLISTISDETGYFQLEAQSYRQVILGTALEELYFDNAEVVLDLENINLTQDLIIDIHNSAINGFAYANNSGINNTEMRLVNAAESIELTEITDSLGYFSFEYLGEGDWTLGAYRIGYQDSVIAATIADYDSLFAEISLEEITGSISGFAKDINNESIQNAVIAIFEDGALIDTQVTNGIGGFIFLNLSELSNYTINAAKTGFNDYLYPELVNINSDELNIEMELINNSILGTVIGTQPPALVTMRNIDGEIWEETTDLYNDFCFSNLHGIYDIWASSGDSLVSQTQTISIAGNSARIELELIDASHILGDVAYNDTGKPGATVYAMDIDIGRVYQDITDINGEFSIDAIVAGTYDISVVLDGFEVEEEFPQISLVQGETIVLPTFHLIFAENSISGVVNEFATRNGIGNAKVSLAQDGIAIDSLITENNGVILFTDLADGNYEISVEHPAYEAAEPISVVMLGGVSDPPTADFHLTPIELIIYGYVNDVEANSIEGATVSINSIESESKRIMRDLYITETDSDGYYAILVDTIGTYTIEVSKENYYNSDEIEFGLSIQEPAYYQNFILNLIPRFADFTGIILIDDQTQSVVLPPDEVTITLTNSLGTSEVSTITFPDSLYNFSQVPVPEIFDLEVSASYNGQNYYQVISNIVIESDSICTNNFTFTYIENSVNFSGTIQIDNEEIVNLANAEVILSANGSVIDTVYTSQSGFFQINNILEDTYQLQITATYENEIFIYNSEPISWSGDDIIYNFIFQYLLAGVGFKVYETAELPLPDVEISVDDEWQIVTNAIGYAFTGYELHSNDYSILLNKDYGSIGRFIEPVNFMISLPYLGYYEYDVYYPLQFDESQLEESFPATEPSLIYFHKNSSYLSDVILHYLDIDGNLNELIMQTENDILLFAEIPAQNNSGTLQIWFSSSDSLNYSSANYPFEMQISSDGIISTDYSQITPQNALLNFNQEFIFELDVADASGTNLNELIEESGEVVWSFSNEALGLLETIDNEKCKIKFYAADPQDESISGSIQARISMLDVTINVSNPIQVKDVILDQIVITGDSEISNDESKVYTITALSSENEVMTINWDLELPSYNTGGFQTYSDGFIYEPYENYIGEFELIVTVSDSINVTSVSANKFITVYQQIYSYSPAQVLDTGEGCKMLLYDNMFIDDESQAKIYLKPRVVAPFKSTGVADEVVGSVFHLNSNKTEAIFSEMPGLEFIVEENLETVFIAYWDNNQLKWIEINETNRGSNILSNVPQFKRDYSALKPSEKLGIYDVSILPNPFTPYDQFGENMGLQIAFKISSDISRFPKVTAKIYTVNGTLVRTIVSNEPMFKGKYEAGESGTLYWDGRTDHNRMARNGRYVIQLIVEDSKDREEIVKTIILIK